MENRCACCGEEKSSLIIYPTSNPEKVAICEDCRSDVVWLLVRDRSPDGIWDLFRQTRRWKKEREAGLDSWLPADTLPVEQRGAGVILREVEQIVRALQRETLSSFSAFAEIRNRIDELRARVERIEDIHDLNIPASEQQVHFCFGPGYGLPVVSFSQAELETLKRVAAAQQELDAKRARG